MERSSINFFASVKLTVLLMSLIAVTILLGAWCPQEAQVGREKVVEAFGPEMARNLIQWGIADIFHSAWFLFLIAMLTVNMVACSVQRVFPKVRQLKSKMPFLTGREISRMSYNKRIELDASFGEPAVLSCVVNGLSKRSFRVNVQGTSLTAEFGKYGRLAATVTHIGLLTLLLGVTITSWTGFSGFQPVRLDETMSFKDSQHSKLWIGQLPQWSVRVDATRRDNYPTGEPKQWYSTLSIVDMKGSVLKKGEISVNDPLFFGGVDIYQSSWGMDAIELSFNREKKELALQPMGKRYAAFLPLDSDTILIFSIMDQSSPLRLFAKRPDWEAPRLITEIKPKERAMLGAVEVKYLRAIPVTGLQYKCDPGIAITFMAFAFIIVGVLMAAIPHRHVWAHVFSQAGEQSLRTPGKIVLYIGGRSLKAKVGFEKMMDRLLDTIKAQEVETAGRVPESKDGENEFKAANPGVLSRESEVMSSVERSQA